MDTLLPSGTSLGRYIVLHVLGRGGMGVVYAAHDPQLDRRVALKLLRSDGAEHALSPELLRREAHALARLSHPNVVRVYDVGVADAGVFLAMELVRGTTLTELIPERRPARELLPLLKAAGRGLAAAHAAGISHRDFKPGNVMVADDGRVLVLDFGLARSSGVMAPRDSPVPSLIRTDALSAPTDGRVVLGTPGYMAPEQLTGGTAGPLSDQFSFSVTAWEVLFGERPLPGARRARRTRAGARWQREVLERGLSEAPEARWPDMRALLEALDRDPTPRRVRWASAAVVGAGVAVTLGLAARARAEQRELCVSQARGLEEVWSESQADEVARAFATTGLSYAVDTWERARPHVESYRRTWSHARLEGCRTWSQTSELGARSVECFDRARAALARLARTWRQPSAAVVRSAVLSVRGLPSPLACLDGEVLARQLLEAAGSRQRETGGRLREALAELDALRGTGLLDEAHALGRALLDDARALREPRLIAAANLRVGLIEMDRGREAAATRSLRDGLSAAEGATDDETALALLNALARFSKSALELDEAEWWNTLAQVKARRLRLPEDHPSAIVILNNAASIEDGHGRYEEALRLHRVALKRWEATLGASHPHVATSLNQVGNALLGVGRVPEGVAAYERAIEIAEQTLGGSHPDVTTPLLNLGNALTTQGEYARALATHQRALRIRERALGAHHPALAYVLGGMSRALSALGRHGEALEAAQRAVRLRTEALGARHVLVGEGLQEVGRVQVAAGRHTEALAAFEEALSILEAGFGPVHPLVGETLEELGGVLNALGRPSDALRFLRRALQVQESTVGPASLFVGQVLVTTGRAQLALGAAREAVDTLERAWRIVSAGAESPTQEAEAELLLAEALWNSRLDLPRARSLARAARGRLRGRPTEDGLAADLARWRLRAPP